MQGFFNIKKDLGSEKYLHFFYFPHGLSYSIFFQQFLLCDFFFFFGGGGGKLPNPHPIKKCPVRYI